jgi:ribosomal subunit interface protein
MKINIKATGIELTPAISSYVNKKVFSIEKYLPAMPAHAGQAGLDKGNKDVVAQVEVGKCTHHHKSGSIFRAEVHITGGGLDLYAVSEMEDLYAAVDIVRDEVIHSMLQSKGKRQTLARRGAEMIKNMMKGITDSFRKRS